MKRQIFKPILYKIVLKLSSILDILASDNFELNRFDGRGGVARILYAKDKIYNAAQEGIL